MSPAAANPTTERRARPRCGHQCNSNQCHQGRTPCPTPQACEVPEEQPATNAEITAFVLVVVAAVVSVCCLLFVGAGA